jgi:uncharacterized protein DUF4136
MTIRPRSVLARGLLLCVAAAIAACASNNVPKKVTARANIDPAANFSGYRTYGFVPMPGTNIEGKTTALTIYMMKAIRQEMDSRGYEYTEDSPELWVNFNAYRAAASPSKTHVTPAYGYSDYYGYRAGLYNIPFVGFGEQEETIHYKVGTANIDIVDARRKVLIWEGIAEGRLTDVMMNSPDESMARIISDMFEKYPGKAPP